MRVKTTEGQIKDVSLLDVTPQNFIVPEGEERYYHCRIEVKKFSADTGARLSMPRMQCFGVKFFENGGLKELQRQGYSVDIIHDPKEWIAAHEKEENERKRQREEDNAKKAVEARQAEKDQLKAEILAELKAAGMLKAEPSEMPEEKKAETRGRKKKAETPEEF